MKKNELTDKAIELDARRLMESRTDIAQKLKRIADLAYGYDPRDKFFNLPRDVFRRTLITAARMLQEEK